MHVVDSGRFGILQMRTSPAGGSRHEAECYLGVLSVEGLRPGLYHYSGLDHSLELLRPGFTPEMAVTASAGQPWLDKASCVFIITAMFERMSFKYRTSSTYKAILLNAGFLGQTCLLTATALGLDVFQTMAIDTVVESWLGLDPFKEGLTLLLACGLVDA
jgi:SagB-type dehydrogenase family enzyme